MKCPYCSHDAIRKGTGNNTQEGLGVFDDDQGYDFAISKFVCTATSTHVFYCNDLNGNSQEEFRGIGDD